MVEGPPVVRRRATHASVRIGALAPLSEPGWVDAGRRLAAGLELAAAHINAGGGIAGRPVELLVRDSAGDPTRAARLVDDLADDGVTALAGEYHSLVARAVAARADALGLPFLCSSAVLDSLTDHPTDWVARLSPPQSRGWRVYADALVAAGHRTVAALTDPGDYWAAGSGVLDGRLAEHAGTLVTLPASEVDPHGIGDALSALGATALLLLVGSADRAARVVDAVRRDPRHARVLVGAPAGQPELPAWADALDREGTGIPFLSYLPAHLPARGLSVGRELSDATGWPSFVTFEGYDTMLALAQLLRTHSGHDLPRWDRVAVQGTRGTIRFTRSTSGWRWEDAPVRVVERDPGAAGRLRALA